MAAVPPEAAIAVPAVVQSLAAGRPVRAVWVNERGGLTFEVEGPSGRRFVKWAPAGSGIDLGREAARLTWAARLAAVPRLLDHGADEAGSWIVTAGFAGESAVADRWRADPGRAVAAIGAGLRRLHDSLPVDACPFSWSAEDRLADARRRAAAGRMEPGRWHREHRGLPVERALELLAHCPAPDHMVVCHGDACAPNTLLDQDGRFAGHVDLGAMGVGDRWADLAVATWSTEWNYGPGWEAHLLDAYGIAPDDERTRYYRLLWDLGP